MRTCECSWRHWLDKFILIKSKMLDRLEVSGSWVSGCFAICFSSFDGTITYPCSLTFYCSIESNLPMVVVAFCIRSNVFPRFSACCFSNITFLLNDRGIHGYLQGYFIWNEAYPLLKFIHSFWITIVAKKKNQDHWRVCLLGSSEMPHFIIHIKILFHIHSLRLIIWILHSNIFHYCMLCWIPILNGIYFKQIVDDCCITSKQLNTL